MGGIRKKIITYLFAARDWFLRESIVFDTFDFWQIGHVQTFIVTQIVADQSLFGHNLFLLSAV